MLLLIHILNDLLQSSKNLNTSNVTVNQVYLIKNVITDYDLNTSNVTVNLDITFFVPAFNQFKYI